MKTLCVQNHVKHFVWYALYEFCRSYKTNPRYLPDVLNMMPGQNERHDINHDFGCFGAPTWVYRLYMRRPDFLWNLWTAKRVAPCLFNHLPLLVAPKSQESSFISANRRSGSLGLFSKVCIAEAQSDDVHSWTAMTNQPRDTRGDLESR